MTGREQVFELSPHAELRVLERTGISGGQLLDRLSSGACFWLDRRGGAGERYALVYCATHEVHVVAVAALGPPAWLKTVLTLQQWEASYGRVAPICLALARQAVLQHAEEEALATSAPGAVCPNRVDAVHLYATRVGAPDSHVHLDSIPIAHLHALRYERGRLDANIQSLHRVPGIRVFRRHLEQVTVTKAKLVASAQRMYLAFGELGAPGDVALPGLVDITSNLMERFKRKGRRVVRLPDCSVGDSLRIPRREALNSGLVVTTARPSEPDRST